MSRKLRRLMAVAAAVAGLAGAAMIGAPASAASGFDRCPNGSFCLFSETHGNGRIAVFKWGSPDLRSQGMDAHVYSAIDKTSHWVVASEGYNYQGSMTFDMMPGSHWEDLSGYAGNHTHSAKVV